MSNFLKDRLFSMLRKKAGKSEPPKSDGRQRSGGQHKTDAPPKPNKATLELGKSEQAWRQKSTAARQQLNDLIQRPLRDGRRPEAILKTAGQFADKATRDGFDKGVVLIDKEFTPALELAENDGKELQDFRDKINDEVIGFEKDVLALGKSGDLQNLLTDAKSRLNDARTKKDMTAVRRLLKRAPLFRPIPDSVDGQGVEKLRELQRTEWAEVEKADAKKAWESAHEEALDICDELKSLEPYCPLEPATGVLRRAEEKAKEDTTNGYKDGATLIEKEFKPASVQARKTAVATHEASREAQDALRRAELDLGKVEGLDGFDTKVNEAKDLYKYADLALSQAKTAETFKAVLSLAQGTQEKLDGILEEAKPLLEAEKQFDDALRVAHKALREVAALPMADTYDEISVPLRDINEAVVEAPNIASGVPRSLQTVNAALDKLKPVEAKRKAAVQAAKKVAGEINGARQELQAVTTELAELNKYRFIKDQAGSAEQLVKQAGDQLGQAGDLAAVNQAKGPLGQASDEIKRLRAANAQRLKFARAAEAEEAKSRSAVEGMKTLPDADKFGPLVRLIDFALKNLDNVHKAAVEATDIPRLRDVISNFERIGAQAKGAAELSAKGGELFGKLAAADKLVAGVERHGFLKQAAAKLRDDVAGAEQGLQTAASLDAAVNAAAPLDGIEAAVKDLLEPKGKQEREELKPKLVERKKYDKLRVEAVTQTAQARQLRGVDVDPEMQKLIQEMDKILETADGMVQKALTKEAVENAGLEFAALKPLKEQAEKRAEALKKEHEGNLKARERYQKALAKGELAATKATGYPGGSEFAAQIRTLVSGARLTVEHDPAGGHAKALASLEDKAGGYAALLKQAKSAGKNFKPDPTVIQKQKEVEGMLDVFAKIASEDAALVYRGEIGAALEKSVKDPAGALKDLESIMADVKKDAARLGVEEKEARKALPELERQLNVIRGFAPAAAVKRAEVAVMRAKEEISVREWAAARDRLQAALDEVKEWADRQPSAQEWASKQSDVQRMIDRCKAVAGGWPPLNGRAGEIQSELVNARAEVGRTGDFKKALAALADVTKDFEQLENDAKGQIPTKDDGEPVDLEALAAARREGSKRFFGAKVDVEKELRDFAQLPQLVGARNMDKIPVYVKHDEISQAWNAFFADAGPGGAVSVDEILRRADQAVKDFKELQARIRKAASNPTALMLELASVVKDLEEVDEKEGRERLETKLAELGRYGVDVSAERGRLQEAFDKSPVDKKQLKELQTDLDKKLTEAGEALKQDAEEGKKQAAEYRKQAGNVKWAKRKFKEYYRKLQDKVDDVDALLQSGDVDLIRQGMNDLKAMGQLLEKDKKDPKRFKPVQAMWDRMGKTLNEGNLVRTRLKETYNRLRKEHEAAIAKAMETEPDQAVKDLAPLSEKIVAARQEAERVDARYKEFKAAYEAVTDLHKKLTKETRTWVTEKCEAFTKKLETRMAAAKRLAKAEGSLEEGFKALEAIRKELEEIRSKPNPREELQKQNGAAAQEQRLVRDMARQFEADLAGFKKLADKVEGLMKQAKKDKDNKGQVIQISQLTRLRRAADGAAKGVEPYTKMFSKQDADPPEDALNAFTQARKQLAELTDSARRLIEEPASTEVADPDELAAIEKEVRGRGRKLATGVEDMIGKVKAEAQKAPTWPPDDTAPTPEQVQETLSKMEKYFSDVEERFTGKRLVKPLKVLKESADKNARKSAREKALREVHRMTQDLLRDDILKEMRNNPYRKLTAETSLLRASLKSLELAVLVGV